MTLREEEKDDDFFCSSSTIPPPETGAIPLTYLEINVPTNKQDEKKRNPFIFRGLDRELARELFAKNIFLSRLYNSLDRSIFERLWYVLL
mmetsp:Transcript_29559/g.41387  ORF Transcript_29559/g.41387 Transcript_29559/m.41387 type:complete len:90 (+) Transcript_29559:186-455(+)